MWTIQDVPGKGKGLVATRPIPRGTRILSEKPIITVPDTMTNAKALHRHLTRQVKSLSPSDKEAFLSFHAIHPYNNNNPAEHYAAILRSVALPIEDSQGQDAAGIFPHACRINHACDNNAQKSWNTTTNRHTVHAIHAIPAGEEITITYVGTLTNRAERQAKLQAKFAFLCGCGLCALSSEESEKKDALLGEILRIERKLNEAHMKRLIFHGRRAMLDLVKRQVDLYNEFGPNDIGLPRAYFDAAQILFAGGDFARGKVFVEKALEGWRVLGGDDSPQVAMFGYMARDQNRLKGCRFGNEWASSFDDVPVGMSEGELEGWLWAHVAASVTTITATMATAGITSAPSSEAAPQLQIATKTTKMANLRNTTHFPTWFNLPHENDPSVWLAPEKHHYCFLGEITESGILLRLEIHLRDVGGTAVIPLYFYTDGRGTEVSSGLCKRGNAVAVLYPVRHDFMFGDPGIRLEDEGLIKIFPTPLSKLLSLSDTIQQFSGVSDTGLRICHGCGCTKAGSSLSKCAKCGVFWYCNADCQRKGWNDKGHKWCCKLLRDRDVMALFKFDWDVYERAVRFPLPV